jgi:hypothetical protein
VPLAQRKGDPSVKSKLVLVVVSITVLAGCRHLTGAEYFHALEDGKATHYNVSYSLLGMQQASLVLRGGPQETINGHTYRKQVAEFSGIPSIPTAITYARMTRQGIFTLNGHHLEIPEQLDPALPLVVGNRWQTVDGDGASQRVAEAIETVDLPDRSYDRCLKISTTGPKGTASEWYAPNIGLVKGVYIIQGMTMEITRKDQAD